MISTDDMRSYLSKSLSSVNENKIRGLFAETEFRNHITTLGFGEKISVGGWIFRNVRGNFSHAVTAVFPEIIRPESQYNTPLNEINVPHGLHTICATFHQIGIRSYFAYPEDLMTSGEVDIKWNFKRLGVPANQNFISLEDAFSDYQSRERRYNFLRNCSNTQNIPEEYVNEEFSKENIRVTIQNRYFAEISDIDGIFWGEQFTYPLEIKEKTRATDANVGEYFGIDVGPFVKLAFYAAKRGNLHSLFVVREINNTEDRELIAWKYITFEKLAQYASWVPMGGGRNMGGGGSTVVKIPAAEFSELDADALARL